MWNNVIFDFNHNYNYNFSFQNSHNDTLTHLAHWQYWWWFWFTLLLTLYYVIIIRYLATRPLKFNPKIVSSYRSHGKWGDMIICLLPISWCLNILTNSTTLLKILEWQSEANFFTMRVRGKQWYWVYKFDIKSMNNMLFSFDKLKKIGNSGIYNNNLSDIDFINYTYVFNFWNDKYANIWFKQNIPALTFRFHKLGFNHNLLNNYRSNINTFNKININMYYTNYEIPLLKTNTNTTFFEKNRCPCVHLLWKRDYYFTENYIHLDKNVYNSKNWNSFAYRYNVIPDYMLYGFKLNGFQISHLIMTYKNLFFDSNFVSQIIHALNNLQTPNKFVLSWEMCANCEENYKFSKIKDINIVTHIFKEPNILWKFHIYHKLEPFLKQCFCHFCLNPNIKTQRYPGLPQEMLPKYQSKNKIFGYTKFFKLKVLGLGTQQNIFSIEPIINRWWRNSIFEKKYINVIKLKYFENNNLLKFHFLKNKIKSYTGNYYGVIKQKSSNNWQKNDTDILFKNSNFYNTNNYYSYLVDTSAATDTKQIQMFNNMRLLKLNRILVLPSNIHINIITNSFDVVHSWFLPGLGLKMDCVPGRSTHHTLFIDTPGMYYGQCAEICGRFHHHMPIRICAMLSEHYFLWWYHVFSFLMVTDDIDNNKKKFNSKLNSFIK